MSLKKDQQIKLTGLLIALGILGFILAGNLKKGQPQKAPPASTAAVVAPPEAPLPVSIVPAKDKAKPKPKVMPDQVKALLNTVGRSDPFTPESRTTGAPGAANAALTLLGVIWDEHSPGAIFGDAIVACGDMIAGRKVLRIEKAAVVLQDSDKELRVNIGENVPDLPPQEGF